MGLSFSHFLARSVTGHPERKQESQRDGQPRGSFFPSRAPFVWLDSDQSKYLLPSVSITVQRKVSHTNQSPKEVTRLTVAKTYEATVLLMERRSYDIS